MFSIADPVFREVMRKPIRAIFTERNTKSERKQQVAKSPTGFNLSKGKKLFFWFVKNLIITNRLNHTTVYTSHTKVTKATVHRKHS